MSKNIFFGQKMTKLWACQISQNKKNTLYIEKLGTGHFFVIAGIRHNRVNLCTNLILKSVVITECSLTVEFVTTEFN